MRAKFGEVLDIIRDISWYNEEVRSCGVIFDNSQKYIGEKFVQKLITKALSINYKLNCRLCSNDEETATRRTSGTARE